MKGVYYGQGYNFYEEQFYGRTSDADFEKNLVFGIMPFSDILNDVYSEIKDECRKLNLRSIRVDEMLGSGIILKKIYNLIERAEFIIADLTDERPNIYYELGYAHSVGNEENEILLIAQAGTKLHFDITPLSVQFYSTTENLRTIVSNHLKRMIKETRV